MGYTHYWSVSKIDNLKFNRIVKDFSKLLPHIDVPLGDGIGEPDSKPIINKNDKIVFNGIGDGSHETMCLENKKVDFDFCKTAYKPYDIAVTSLLIIAKHHLKDGISVRSDGENEDWESAKKLVYYVLEYGTDFILD